MAESIHIKVTRPQADWFSVDLVSINPENYGHFKLKAQNLIWKLEAYQSLPFGEEAIIEHWSLDNSYDASQLIEKLNIKQITGNQYKSIKELFKINKPIVTVTDVNVASSSISTVDKKSCI